MKITLKFKLIRVARWLIFADCREIKTYMAYKTQGNLKRFFKCTLNAVK